MTPAQMEMKQAMARMFASLPASERMTPSMVCEAVAGAYAQFLTTVIVAGYVERADELMMAEVFIPAERTMYLLDRMLREDIETTLVEHLRAKGETHGR